MEKVKLTIAGEIYNLSTDDNAESLMELGEDLNRKIKGLMETNGKISVTQAAVLTSLEYMDSYKKSEMTCENLRTQIQDYLEDAARSRTDAEISKREVEKLNKELNALKSSR